MATGGYEILTQKPAKIKLIFHFCSTRISKLSKCAAFQLWTLTYFLAQKVINFEQFSIIYTAAIQLKCNPIFLMWVGILFNEQK